jgi:hypothetical protein
MKTLLPALLLAVLTVPAAAQSLPTGLWTGSVTPTGEEPLALTFEVTVSGDTISIMMITPDRGSYPVENAQYKDDTLTFVFHPGPRVQCSLPRQSDGSYTGECKGEDDLSAVMTMVPPKKG